MRPKKPSDKALIAFWRCISPEMVATWEAELRAKVERYRAWPVGTFTITDHEHDVRIVVCDRTVVTVLPKRQYRKGRQ